MACKAPAFRRSRTEKTSLICPAGAGVEISVDRRVTDLRCVGDEMIRDFGDRQSLKEIYRDFDESGHRNWFGNFAGSGCRSHDLPFNFEDLLIKDRFATLSKTVGDEASLLSLIVASTPQVIATGDANAKRCGHVEWNYPGRSCVR